ncbi:MAG: cell wall anchor protein [Bacteroidales bacterium]|nr:cell wall anchor protein [Bacteroidales bacterium]
MKTNFIRIRAIILITALFVAFGFAEELSAQGVSVKAKIDSTQMWIGNQTALTFEVIQKQNQKVQFPVFSDTIVGNLEIVEQEKRDTLEVSDDDIQVNAKYTVTSFEDSLVYIPEYPFVFNGDTTWSNSLSIRVIQPFVIDTASNQLADIKPVYKPPFNWKRFFLRGLLVMLLIALAIVLYFLIKKLMVKKPAEVEVKPKNVITPHEEAFKRLDRLKEKKLWQSGQIKEYHTELTDIIRIYIEKMFNIGSMEMTSDEILNHVKFMKTDKSAAFNALRQMLTLADLVKFAKWNPSPSDHELSMMNAYLFVNQTKIEEVKPLDKMEK